MNVGDVYFEKNTVIGIDLSGVHSKCEEVDAIEIPKNSTNGDMIRALFPKASIECEKFLIKVHFREPAKIAITFHKCWWDAPYKKGRD